MPPLTIHPSTGRETETQRGPDPRGKARTSGEAEPWLKGGAGHVWPKHPSLSTPRVTIGTGFCTSCQSCRRPDPPSLRVPGTGPGRRCPECVGRRSCTRGTARPPGPSRLLGPWARSLAGHPESLASHPESLAGHPESLLPRWGTAGPHDLAERAAGLIFAGHVRALLRPFLSGGLGFGSHFGRGGGKML